MRKVDTLAEIDKLISSFFAAFDNRNGLAPDLATLLGYFADKAVISRASGSDIQIYSAMEFVVPRIELLTGSTLVDFHEAEISSTTNIFGSIASRTSRYRKAGQLDGKPYAGVGTKLFVLVALESGWRILSLAWVDDDA